MGLQLEMPLDEIAAFCRRHRIRRLAVFGSALRDDFRPDSDVDVLVQFEDDARVGLLGLAATERTLSELLGREVELHTVAGLHPSFREQVLAEAEVQYEQA